MVCRVRVGEKMIGINYKEYKFDEKDLVIVDVECVVVIVGVMGGEVIEVIDIICRIFIECVYFDPMIVCKFVKCHDLYMDLSYCFECGIDLGVMVFNF